MSSPDLDYCELYISIKNFFSGQPYIDVKTGQTTMNMTYEACEIVETMYEPQAEQMSTATVLFPTVLDKPDLRDLLANVREGDRVEIYHFQPDVGNPVFGGFIPPGGITIDGGQMSLSLQDCLGRGQWMKTRPYEDLDTNADGYYTRAMSQWKDYVNEPFDIAHWNGPPNTIIADTYAADVATTAVTQGSAVVGNGTFSLATTLTGSPTIDLSYPGATVLIECFGTSQTDWGTGASPGIVLENTMGLTFGTGLGVGTIYFDEIYTTDTGVALTGNSNHVFGVTCSLSAGTNIIQSPPNYTSSLATGILPYNLIVPMPATHLYALLLTVNDDHTISASAFVDYVQVTFAVFENVPPRTDWTFNMATQNNGTNTFQTWNTIRVRTLAPWINRAARFVPQTQDATEFTCSTDDMYTFLNNFTELDFAEYRPIYKQWPVLDELELDELGKLGVNASQVLGIQGGNGTDGIAGAEVGDFLNSPPFRFEEGWNLETFPGLDKSKLTHANNIIRTGSGTTGSQNYFEAWNPSEVGNPFGKLFGTMSNAQAQYPYFETLINDDRTSLTSVIQTLAANDLKIRSVPVTPTYNITVAEDLRFAFQYRAGDTVRLKTRTLIPNVDDDFRIMQITHDAGQTSKAITMGRIQYDPSMMGVIQKDMVETWLYTQSGSGQVIYVYPYVPSTIASGAYSGHSFPILLTQFTSATAVMYVALHWFTSGSVLASDFEIGISGVSPVGSSGTNLVQTTAIGQDSNLVNVTGYFPGPGTYYIDAKNVSGSSAQLDSLFVIVKMKE